MRNLWNALADNSQFEATTEVNLSTGYSDYLTHNITSLISASTNVKWIKSSNTVNNEYLLYSSDNQTKKLVMHISTPSPVSLTDVRSFGEISVNNQEGFNVDAFDLNHNVLSSLSGFMYVQNSDNTTENVSVGNYGMQTPVSCKGTPYQITDDLTRLLKRLVITQNDFNDVITSKNLTASYYYTPLLSTALSPSGCKIKLNTHLSGAFDHIVITGDVIPCGQTQSDGTYSGFYMLADYFITVLGVQHVVHDTIFGSSACLHINRCLCPEINEWDLKKNWVVDELSDDGALDIPALVSGIQQGTFATNYRWLTPPNETNDAFDPRGNLVFYTGSGDRQLLETHFTVSNILDELDFELTPFFKAHIFINNHEIAVVENQCAGPYNTYRFKGYRQYLHIGSDNKLTVLFESADPCFATNWWENTHFLSSGDSKLQGLFNGVVRRATPCSDINDFNPYERPHFYQPQGDPCQDQLTTTALNNAQSEYEQYMDNLAAEITEKYRSHCMNSLVENFTGNYPDQEYHFTLYYYDQAGNLVKTIPPEGVELLQVSSDSDPLELQIKADRTNNTHTVFTSHRMETRYEYNSLNQLVKQVTPDQDKMDIWEKRPPSRLPAALAVTATQFVNASKGYLAGNIGSRGVLYQTDNGGATWVKVNDLVASDLKKVQIIAGTTTGYAIGGDGTILRSTNGGSDWDMLSTSITGELNDLFFVDANNGIVVGANGKSYITTNGTTFTAMNSLPATTTINAVANYGGTYYIATGDNGIGHIYSKSGSDWVLPSTNNMHSKNLAKVTYGNSRWNATGIDGTLLVSSDGISWQVVESQTTRKITDIHYFSNEVCIALIEDQDQKKQLMKSADGGKTWSALGAASARYHSLFVNSATGGYAVGFQGAVSQIAYSNVTHTVGIMPVNEPEANFTAEISGIHASADGNKIWIATTEKIFFGSRSIENYAYNFTWVGADKTSAKYIKSYAYYNGTSSSTILLLNTDNEMVKATFTSGTPSSISVDATAYATGISDISATTDKLVAVTTTGAVKCTNMNPIGSSLADIATSPGTITNIVSLASHGNEMVMASSTGNLYKATFYPSSVAWTEYSSNITPLTLNDLYTDGTGFCAVGNCGSMYRYASGQWQPVSTRTTAKLTSVKTNSTQTVFAGAEGTLSVIENNTVTPVATATDKELREAALNSAFDKGYAVGADGTVLYMEKTGGVWNVQPTPGSGSLDLDYNGLIMTGSETAILVGSRSSVYYQAGMGSLKNVRVYTSQLKSLSFANTLNGYIIGTNGLIRHTTDGGITWHVILPGSSTALNTVCATSADNALIGGDAGYLVPVSGNTLSTPVAVSALNGENINTIKTNGSITCIAANGGKAVWKPNASSTWTALGNGTGNLKAIHIFHNDALVIVGSNSFIGTYRRYNADGTPNTNYTLVTLDKNQGGVIPAGTQLNDVYFHDDRNGYVVGNGGAIYKCKLDNDAFEGPIGWIAKTLDDDYGITQLNASTVNLAVIAFPSRYNGFIAGNIGGTSVYARLLHDESELYSTYFWYDRLGRMVVSRNTRQFNNNAYSYTRYDELGRIKEVGEITEPSGTLKKFCTIFGDYIGNMHNPDVINDENFNQWILANSRSQITRTFYDAPLISQTGITQENLRKRVATATYSDAYNSSDLVYDYATHYSYDIHGNVKALWQDNPQLTGDLAGQRFKRIDYDYDLVSGKVNGVKYQAGQPDQFIHRYDYDADNRITEVYTSKDGIRFDRDARYYYYLHGPLARVEVGNDLVQGIDYAYTLQGWIKGVNSNSLNENRDMGADGKTGSANVNVARDAFGYSLNYFDGDYAAIDPDKWDNVTDRFEAGKTGSDWMGSNHNLYNGNISSMATTITNPATREVLPLGATYQYDQLNRIKEMKSYSNLNITANSWPNENNDGNKYFNNYSYDANGNILSLQRKNKDGVMFDEFTYNYRKSGGKTVSNRLYHVNDAAASNLMPDDIDDEGTFSEANINSANNYGYDETGNLKFDKAEGIETIAWTAYGKIKSITRRSDYTKTVDGQTVYPSNLEFRYDATGNRIAKIEKPRDANGEKSSAYWITTYYVRDATGNPMVTYKEAPPSAEVASFKLIERPIYGSSRIGIDNTQLELFGYTAPTGGTATYELGLKQYELTNHLGNVLSTVSDKKIPHTTNGTDIDYYLADITSAADYYPFGSPMDGRTFSSEKYRFGFNGKENDNEVKGAGNSLDFGARIYDSRLGRWLSCDPSEKKISRSKHIFIFK